MALTQAQQSHAQVQLPPPQTFDILPALHELLARIDHTTTSTDLTNQEPADPSDIGALYSELQPLEPKDLPTEVLEIKRKIRRALKELEKLPDMERSVEEQSEEIQALESRIARQKEMVTRLGLLAREVNEKNG
jgi:predicted RNase H-like nuclease (RuvC/YqgF family)